MFSRYFFEDKYGERASKTPASEGELRKAIDRGEDFGKPVTHKDGESILVDVAERDHIATFIEMSSKHINELVAEGKTFDQIKKCCIIDAPNPVLKKKVSRAIDCLIYAALAKKKLGRYLTDDEAADITSGDLEHGTEALRRIVDGEEEVE